MEQQQDINKQMMSIFVEFGQICGGEFTENIDIDKADNIGTAMFSGEAIENYTKKEKRKRFRVNGPEPFLLSERNGLRRFRE